MDHNQVDTFLGYNFNIFIVFPMSRYRVEYNDRERNIKTFLSIFPFDETRNEEIDVIKLD